MINLYYSYTMFIYQLRTRWALTHERFVCYGHPGLCVFFVEDPIEMDGEYPYFGKPQYPLMYAFHCASDLSNSCWIAGFDHEQQQHSW